MIPLNAEFEKITFGDYILIGYYQNLLQLQKQYDGKINIKITHIQNIIHVWVSLQKNQYLNHYILNIHNVAIIYPKIENELMILSN